MNDNNLTIILNIINEWWEQETIPDEAMNARVVLIYKKGDTSLCENYRPISLLNTCYKLIAAALQRRIEAGIDHLLQRTQYGFRKSRSTREALYNIRRVITAGESTKTKTFLLLLDWAKAFDKIDHEGLISALERHSIAPKLINLIKDIYRKATFFVEIDGHVSRTYKQETGIRQGCPLSPYLFLIVMTTIFHDIHDDIEDTIIPHRAKNATFDEILFADDTICVSENAEALTLLLHKIQEKGQHYGLTLNMDKCEIIRISRATEFTEEDRITFIDGTSVKTVHEAKYLGC